MKSLSSNPYLVSFCIAVAAAILFTPLLGEVHLFDWDEINFAESAREMLMSNDFFHVQINYSIFWEKPPFFIWLQALSMHFLGINEYAARFPNAVIGIITLVVIYNLGRKLYDEKFGLFWVIAYAGSFLPHFYFKSGIIDPLFNLFIFLGIYNLAILSTIEKARQKKRYRKAVVAGFFIGMAILTKGPVALLVCILSALVYCAVKKSIKVFTFRDLVMFTLPALIIFMCWFGYGYLIDGPFFMREFIAYQIRLFKTRDAGHGGPFIYHWVVLLVGCFPASMYLFKSFIKQYSDTPYQRTIKTWVIISFFVVLILFSIVQSKIIHYSSFCYFPLTFLAAYTLHKIYRRRLYLRKFYKYVIFLLGLLICIPIAALPILMKYKDYWFAQVKPHIKDPFAVANMETQVHWSGWEATIGIFYFVCLLVFLIIEYRNSIIAAIFLYVSTAITLQLALYIIVPKVEVYVQGAVVSFYESMQGKDVYVESSGYKSYGKLFYTRKMPGLNPKSADESWLINGDIDKPVYFATKITFKDFQNNPQIKLLYCKNGYCFYKRDVPGK